MPTFVFPRNHSYIEHSGGTRFLGGPDRVSFYNTGQQYRRFRASPEGDDSDWYVVAPDTLREVIRRYDPAVDERPDRPFLFAYGPSDSASYGLQRRAFDHARRVPQPDAMFIEEAILSALDRAVGAAYRAWRGGQQPRLVPGHRELAEHARWAIGRRFTGNLSMTDVAREVGASAFHLCRVFRRHTGLSLHQYKEQLRLRRALDRVLEERDLTTVALDLGYSSHSHFTMAFRKAFGMTPSQFRGSSSKIDKVSSRQECLLH